MPNPMRGEVSVRVAGKPVAIALTLGTLAAIEDAFGGRSYEDVFAEIITSGRVSATTVLKLMIAVFEANGIDDAATVAAGMDGLDMLRLAVDLLKRAFPEPKPGRKGTTRNP